MYKLFTYNGDMTRKIDMIKELRYLTGFGLKEAKDAVEGFLDTKPRCFHLAIPASVDTCLPEQTLWKKSHDDVEVLDANCYLSPIFTPAYKLETLEKTNAFLRTQLNDAKDELARLKSTRDLSNLLAGMLQTTLNADGHDPQEINAMRALLDKLIEHNNLFPRYPERSVTFTVPMFGWYDAAPLSSNDDPNN